MRPGLALCFDRRRLVEEIRQAMNHVIALNNREMEAVISGSFASLPPIKAELVSARQRKDSLLESYHDHLRDHGC